MPVAVSGRVPVADLFGDEFGERLVRGQCERELRGVALDDFVMKFARVFDHRRRGLRGDLGVHGEHGLARDLGDFTLPAQGDGRFRAEKTFHAGNAVGLESFQQRAGQQLDFGVRAGGLRGDARDGRGGAGEGNLVPRFGVLDFDDDLEAELEMARTRGDEQITVAVADDFQLVGKFSGENGYVAF